MLDSDSVKFVDADSLPVFWAANSTVSTAEPPKSSRLPGAVHRSDLGCVSLGRRSGPGLDHKKVTKIDKETYGIMML